jgi:hypothetical protein
MPIQLGDPVKQIQLVIDDRNVIAEVSAFNNKQHVEITPICAAVGIAAFSQRRRLQSNPQFNPHHMMGVGADGKQREMLMLPVEEVGMWLCGINSARVNESVRGVLLEFQKHCQTELYAAITGIAGTDRVAALEKQVADLTVQVSKMVDFMASQQATIDHLAKMVQPMANVEKHIASIGGKFMAVARGTKKLRDEMQ